jgi:hypothetical protein
MICKRCETSGHDLIEDSVLTFAWNDSVISQKTCQDSQSLDPDLKLGPLEYEAEMLPTHTFFMFDTSLICSVCLYIICCGSVF